MWHTISIVLIVLVLSFFQTLAATVNSRGRNRNHVPYHVVTSIFSHGVWFLSFTFIVKEGMPLYLIFPYILGNVIGSVYGAKISMYFERKLNAVADAHIQEKT